ncbi:MAG: hypothetical protein ACD_46C00575G0007 [uncultured bacterium]|nr:MAG: hypothetical protein ACD_46C00575G0007 [uncultured bacterium]
MNLLMKWTFIFAALMLITQTGHAWTIGSKQRVNGPSIHSTYFFTANNQFNNVHAQMYVGAWVNGTCQYAAHYDMGNEILRTGNYINIDAFKLQSIIGGNYSCMTIFYTSRQLVMETFQLQWNGSNYINTIPATAEVTII